jgi:hypothetical protein
MTRSPVTDAGGQPGHEATSPVIHFRPAEPACHGRSTRPAAAPSTLEWPE